MNPFYWTLQHMASSQAVSDFMSSDAIRAQKVWQDSVLKIEIANETFATAYAQAIDDMSALRLPIEGTDHMKFVPAAGLPWFVALFGRDSLIIPLQNAIVHPEFALGALSVLARWQATERDDYCRTGQNSSRVTTRRTRAFQTHSAHALLRNRGRNSPLSHYAPHGLDVRWRS